MKRLWPYILIVLAGVTVMFYPAARKFVSAYQQDKAIASYTEQLDNMDAAERSELLEAAREYNYAQNRGEHTEGAYYANLERLGDVIGTLTIPKIDLKLPIYHGTSEAVLQHGVGHLEGTSLPVGGVWTHSVLTGHRGLPSSVLFTHLDELTAGDMFYITVLDEVLAYKVCSIAIIEPESYDGEVFAVWPDRDLVTLMTCHPYGINTHRLLVTGERVLDYDANELTLYEASAAVEVDVKGAEEDTGFRYFIGTPHPLKDMPVKIILDARALLFIALCIILIGSAIVTTVSQKRRGGETNGRKRKDP